MPHEEQTQHAVAELAELDELDVDVDLDGPEVEEESHDPEDHSDPPLAKGELELLRLSDVVRRNTVRYAPKCNETLRQTFTAYKSGKCPEYFEAVRAAYAACYYVRKEAKQDIVEQAAAEAFRLYVECEHGLIRATCTCCESTKSQRFELPFDIDGLKKLATRLAERLKKREYKRSYKRVFQHDEVEEASLTDEDVPDDGRTEDNIIAKIDAERGHVDTGNERLMRLLARVFTKSELAFFLKPPSKNGRYQRLLKRFKAEYDASLLQSALRAW